MIKFPPASPQQLQETRNLQEQIPAPPSPIIVPFDVASVSATVATALTVPDGQMYRLDFIMIHNPNGSAHDIDIWVVPSGGMAGPTNLAIQENVLPTETEQVAAMNGAILGEGVSIQHQAPSAGAETLNMWVSCTQIVSGT